MKTLGNALREPRPKEALPVYEANLALMRRYWSLDKEGVLIAQSNLANCHSQMGQDKEALRQKRHVHASWEALLGPSDPHSITSLVCLAISLLKLHCFAEAKTLLREKTPVVQRALGATLCRIQSSGATYVATAYSW